MTDRHRWQEALFLHRTGEWDAATSLYESLLNEPDFQAEACHQLGLIAAQQGQYEVCVQKIQRAIQIQPNTAVFHNNLGNALIRLKNFTQAAQHFQTALQLSPNYAEACNNLGRLFHKQEAWEASQQYYTKAIQLNPHYLEAHLNLGLLLVSQHKTEAARQQFQRLLTLHPNTPQAHEQLAQLAIHTQDWDTAHTHYQQLLKIAPDSSDAWNNLGALFSKTQSLKQAIAHVQKALELNPHHVNARCNLAAFYLQDNQLKEAIWHYMLYLRQCPTDSEAYYNLGVARMLSGHLPEAIASFQKTIDLVEPKKTSAQITPRADLLIEAWCNLGALYLRQGNSSLAVSAYQQALTLDAQHPIAGYMIDALTQQKNPVGAPLAYVKHLFDQYAPYFDLHLTHALHYQVPQALYELVATHLKEPSLDIRPLSDLRRLTDEERSLLEVNENHRQSNNEEVGKKSPFRKRSILDLGCGTGLSGQAFKPIACCLIGVDISSAMLAEAKKKEIYDELIEEDILRFLTHSAQSYDLILCVDTLVYFGDLRAIFEQVASRLQSGAYWAFSIELSKSGDYQLQTTGRYQHSFDAIQSIALQHHFKLVDFRTSLGRQHLDHPVPIGLFLLQKDNGVLSKPST